MRSPTGSTWQGPQLDDWVDRPEVEARQRVQLTGTNRPSGLASTLHFVCVHCAAPEIRSARRGQGVVPLASTAQAPGGPGPGARRLGRSHLNRVSAVIAKGKHPVPFRTRKLSPSAPMVLRGGPRGRVGRRRTCLKRAARERSSGPLRLSAANVEGEAGSVAEEPRTRKGAGARRTGVAAGGRRGGVAAGGRRAGRAGTAAAAAAGGAGNGRRRTSPAGTRRRRPVEPQARGRDEAARDPGRAGGRAAPDGRSPRRAGGLSSGRPARQAGGGSGGRQARGQAPTQGGSGRRVPARASGARASGARAAGRPAAGGTARLRVPDSVSARQLDPDARAQLNSLPNDLAEVVARYLVAAGLDEDPEQGYAYARAAKRLAARVGVVREACAIAAYRTGRWAEALAEFRAARRMTGRQDYLPVMDDCERALGRPDQALALIREADDARLDRATWIELRIVESGIRRDQGLADAAVLALRVPELTSGRPGPWSARLLYAYADALLAAGREDEARQAFAAAAAADTEGETDAAERLDELDGVEVEDLAGATDPG